MSEIARLEQSKRRLWAKGGGAHDRTVRVMRVLLPAAVGALGAWMLYAPFAARSELSFLLSKDQVEMAKERLRVTSATYRGQDARGRPFELNAQSAVQKTSAEPVVRITGLDGRITLSDGPARVVADQGAYDMRTETVGVPGTLDVTSSSGYALKATGVTVDLKARAVRGSGGVRGSLPIGRFSADRLFADLDKRIVRLDGNARMTIHQGAL